MKVIPDIKGRMLEKTDIHMKKIGIIILGIIILAGIAVLTLVFQVIEFIVGAILFLVAIFFLGYLFKTVKDKLD